MEKGGRKAQITVFIIIGLILLVSASIVIYMTTIRKVEVIEEIMVPPEVKPVYDFVTNCLYEIGGDALVLIGAQGGYVDLSPDRIETRDITLTPPAYIKIDPSNTFKLPHWYYEGEDRTPTIGFIQKELADYVRDNLQNCLDNFAAFEPQYQITELGQPQLDSVFTDDDVVVRLKYPLEIMEGGRTTSHEDFISHIPVRMKKMWELADAIMKTENDENFFENITIGFIAMDPEVPMDGFSLKCSMDTWTLDSVEKRVQEVLRMNLPRVRVAGTDYPEFEADEDVYKELKKYGMKEVNEGKLPDIPTPIDAYEYNRMFMDPGVSGVEDLRVSFIYMPTWGMSLNALPNEGGRLRTNTAPGQSFLSMLCMNVFHFTYDIIYPIQVRIFDPDAYDEDGYIFQFGFPVLIDDNEPNRDEFGVRLFEDFYVDTGFCDQTGGEVVEIRAVGYDEYGYRMDSGIRDVNITYRCIRQQCELGSTGYSPAAPGRYSLITSIPPSCSNPIIIANKGGYLPAKGQLTGDSLELEMIKTRTLPVTVVKHPYSEAAGLTEQGMPLVNGDQIFIFARAIGVPEPLSNTVTVEYGQNETQYIEIVDDTNEYVIDAMYNNYDRFVGGYKATNVSLKYSDLSGAQEMVIHVFEYRPRPISSEQIIDMMQYYTAMEYADTLKPTFR